MRKELIQTGKTVDSAIDAACRELGCEREECEWEIVDLPKKGFLGLKTYPAKVRVSFESPDPVKPAVKQEQKKPEPKPAAQAKPAVQQAKTEQRPAQQPKREPKPAAHETKQDSDPAAQRTDTAPARRNDSRRKDRDRDRDEERPRTLVTEGFTGQETTTMEYIQSILREFGLTAALVLEREDGGIRINITGDGLGAIIGRRGETLDAIQYLASLVSNRMDGDYLRVTVDCGNYRGKRKETLEVLAKKLAAQVLKTNVSKTLEPMNPFERRVIHATVSKIEGVSSSSVGEEPNRRVVITSPTARRPAPRRDGDRDRRPPREHDGNRERAPYRGGRPDRSRSDRGERSDHGPRDDRRLAPRPVRSETAEAFVPPKSTPETEFMANAPLGKLDLE